jgi:hypothetical protein
LPGCRFNRAHQTDVLFDAVTGSLQRPYLGCSGDFTKMTGFVCLVIFVTDAALNGASRCLAKLLPSGGFFVIRHPG